MRRLAGLVAYGLSHLLIVSVCSIDRQLTIDVPRIQVRPVDHEKFGCVKMTVASSKVEGSPAVGYGLFPIRPLL